MVETCVRRWPKPSQSYPQHRNTGLVIQEAALLRKKKTKQYTDLRTTGRRLALDLDSSQFD